MKTCSLEAFEKALQDSSCQVLDVREKAEFNAERLDRCCHHPLSAWKSGEAVGLQKDKPLYVVCLAGGRASRAAEQLEQEGFENVYVVEGGLTAWKQAGKPVVKGTSQVWNLERQVRFAAGFLVLIGALGSIWVHKGFLGLSIFVACGLMFAAVTDTCGMGMLLARMPWNQMCNK